MKVDLDRLGGFQVRTTPGRPYSKQESWVCANAIGHADSVKALQVNLRTECASTLRD